jgi:hypothetical protein
MEFPRFASSKKDSGFFDFHAWIALTVWAAFLLPSLVYGGTDYYQHVYFDNSLTPDAYFYSSASASAPSNLEQRNYKLPVETKTFLTPPNALRIEWQSRSGGGWQAEVQVVNFRNRYPEFQGTDLYFWCFAPQAIAAADLPLITLSNTREGLQVAQFPGSFTESLPLGKFSGNLPAGRWVQIRIPLSEFNTGSIYEFQAKYCKTSSFIRARLTARHTLCSSMKSGLITLPAAKPRRRCCLLRRACVRAATTAISKFDGMNRRIPGRLVT